ncbi:hypothetical protein LguiA_033155 [Lonicera macranthoides]
MLRYGNSSFFSTLEDQPSVYLVSPQNVTEQAWFRRMLGETMDELAKMASTDSPNDQFVKDAIELTDVQSLQFDLGIIQAATNNFSNENKIGQGRFGMVYKGILANGQEKAVKRLSKSSRQGELEFKNEVVLVAKLRNRNLVRLLGFCLKGEEKILVYEYAWKMWKDGTPLELMDPTLVDSHVRNEVMKCIQMGLFCVQEDVDSRPSLAAIVLMLGRYTVSLSLPE